jgi:hypothetical protein
MNPLSSLLRHARALVLTLIAMPSILSKVWQEEEAKWAKNADGSPKTFEQHYGAIKAEAEHRRAERGAGTKA